jgi:hypothetical protein
MSREDIDPIRQLQAEIERLRTLFADVPSGEDT